jgi:protein phosphatase
VIGHIGDSRCYRLRGQVFQQITKDHSWVQAQLDAGLITAQQALTSAHKNLVTRALGVTNTVLLEVNEHRVKSGDIYLMCSDGLSDMLLDAGIASILSSHGTLREKAERLVIAAKEGGGRDNISVVLAHAVEDTRKKSFLSRLLGK